MMVPKFQTATACLSCCFRLKFFKIKPLALIPKLPFQTTKFANNHETEFPRPYLQRFTKLIAYRKLINSFLEHPG
jgi:hypothetical protein